MEEPELIKMLKYILLGSTFLISVHCGPLITELRPAVVPVPIHDSGENFSEVIPSLISTSSGGSSLKTSSSSEPLSVMMTMIMGTSGDGAGGRVMMSPVPHISEIQDDLAPNTTGGQKHVRQVHDTSSGSPPPSDELCSIFQFFLEPRRYSRCRVSNTYSSSEHGEEQSLTSDGEMIESEPAFGFAPNYHGAVSNEVIPSSGSSSSDNFQSESETRDVESSGSGQRELQFPSPRMIIDQGRRGNRQPAASKRYDHIDEITVHHGHPPGSEEHLIAPLPPPGPPPNYPKSSLDRTTIIVPERPCPRGERRDHKGFCRRIVRVRPSYQYGPPPPPYGHPHSRPIRYYYSRFVSVPTLQFFIPSVP